MDHENHHTGHVNAGYGGAAGWDMNQNYNSPSQHQSPVYEQNGFTFIQQPLHGVLPTTQPFPSQRMPMLQPSPAHQQLHPLIMPSSSTWPSMLTNPASYPPPVTVPISAPPVIRGNSTRVASTRSTSTPRKTLTDSDRRRMCQYLLDYPHVKQTEVGTIFGVDRSTVSKVVCKKEKWLGAENGGHSPVKRKGNKFPDIDRTLAMWAKKMQQQGHPLTDDEIKDKANFFAATVRPNNESYQKMNSSGWLEKFKGRNGIGRAKLTRRASETNVSDSSLNPESAGHSASQTPNGVSPTSPGGLPSPSPLSATKSEENLRSERPNEYFGHESGGYRHSHSQSTTSLSSTFTDNAPTSFSAGPTSPATPFAFSPDQAQPGSWFPSQQAHVPPGNFQRPRSQTFPILGIDPSIISSQGNEILTPQYHLPLTAPSSALGSPMDEMPPPFGMDSAISSPQLHSLHHSSTNGCMAHSSNGATVTGLQSPPRCSASSSPTQDDARRALETLLAFLNQSTNAHGLVDHDEYLTVVKLTDKLRLNSHGPLPGGLHRIVEQDCEIAPKMEQSMSAGC